MWTILQSSIIQCVLISNIVTEATQRSSFNDLSPEILTKIMSWVPNDDSGRRFNKITSETLSSEIVMIQTAEQLIYSTTNNTSFCVDDWPWNKIKSISKELQLSSEYRKRRPRYFKHIQSIYPTKELWERLPFLSDIFYTRSITLEQYHNLWDRLHDLPFNLNLSWSAKHKLQILLGSSRALLHPFLNPSTLIEKIAKNDSLYVPVQTPAGEKLLHKQLPWCYVNMPTGNRFYLDALFKFIWNNHYKELNLPNYESIWYLDKDPDCHHQLKFLKYLINEHYLNVHSLNHHKEVNSERAQVHSEERFRFHMDEAQRLNRIFFGSDIKLQAEFMEIYPTALSLRLEFIQTG